MENYVKTKTNDKPIIITRNTHWYQLTQVVPGKGLLNGCCFLLTVT